MLKDFWDKKKDILQFVGGLTAIGAIFLAIPLPTDNLTAKDALLNIQFIWLLLISIGVFIILLTFYLFFTQVENEISKKYNIFTLFGSMSFVMMGLIITFAINLWRYAFSLYHDPLIKFLEALTTAAIWFVLGIAGYFLSKSRSKFNAKLYDAIESALWSLFTLLASISSFIFEGRFPFNKYTAIATFCVTWFLIFLAARFRTYRNAKRARAVAATNAVQPEASSNAVSP